ncbi:NAD-dependent epimerase/dehydratase family protein [Vallicoccus soli]|uniref:NAD(P)-dependent oxidoreductase n=1 Tax=Vallicoccus soli TaxID=2339232 RepID=A0A3A3YU64_9ACTN|nr:NAD(P)-dependent oxidoreductase [Vallicoccus soli]
MRLVVTGSAGHLGEALVRVLRAEGHGVLGLDLLPSPTTDVVADVADRAALRDALRGADGVLHTATLHKPHVASHPREAFVRTNVQGTLAVVEEAAGAGVGRVVVTSTTSAYGRALSPAPGEPAAWVDEDVVPVPRNVYGATKVAAEDLCEVVHRETGLPVLVLRTSRFFPEGDDVAEQRAAYDDANLKANELLHRRVDLEDVVAAHRCALERAPALRWGRYVVSAPTPFTRGDAAELRRDAAAVVRRLFPGVDAVYGPRGWRLPPSLDRVYDSTRARRDLGWAPRWTFGHALAALAAGGEARSALAASVGTKGYHDRPTGPCTAAGRAPR